MAMNHLMMVLKSLITLFIYLVQAQENHMKYPEIKWEKILEEATLLTLISLESK